MKKSLSLVLSVCFASPFALSACESPSSPPIVDAPLESVTPPEIAPIPLPDSASSDDSSEPPVIETPPVVEVPPVIETPPVVEVPPVVETPPVIPKAEYIKCTGDSVNIRSGAGTSFSVVGSAEKGGMYALTGKVGNWYKTYYRGKTAYISASYATVFSLEKTENPVENVIAEGYKLLGVPYVYGAVRLHDGNGKLLSGFTVQKFDCSSLVQYIFHKGANALLGVHTRAQVKQGTFVKRSDLQRGDCIFFTNEDRRYNVGIERVGHVALYLGEGYILHTSSDYARIEKISAKRWSFYIEARRFL